jgi:hypothetical protein|eukprot:COSAG01_NODE_8143_length_2906_cov_1.440328_4_plen_224_part_00
MAGMGGMVGGLGGLNKIEDRQRSKGDDELDPYVKCTLLPMKMDKETEDCKDAGPNPKWDATHKNVLRFQVKAGKHSDASIEPRLRVEVFDEDMGIDDFLGQAIVPLWALVDPASYAHKIRMQQQKEKEKKIDAVLNEAKQSRDALKASMGIQAKATVEEIRPVKPSGAGPPAGFTPGYRRMSAPDAVRASPRHPASPRVHGLSRRLISSPAAFHWRLPPLRRL